MESTDGIGFGIEGRPPAEDHVGEVVEDLVAEVQEELQQERERKLTVMEAAAVVQEAAAADGERG